MHNTFVKLIVCSFLLRWCDSNSWRPVLCFITWLLLIFVGYVDFVLTRRLTAYYSEYRQFVCRVGQLISPGSRGAMNIHLGHKSRVRSKVKRPNPSRWSGRLCPPEAEAVCRHCLQILTAETIKTWQFHTIHLLILDQCVLDQCVSR